MNTKMKTKTGIGIALVVLIAAVAMAAPASADYSGDRSLVTYDHDTIKGGVVYVTVEDGSAYTNLQAMPEEEEEELPSLTQSLTVEIPDGATVKMARLYNYYTWSTADNGDGSNPGMPAEADMWFGIEGATPENRCCQHGLGDGIANRCSLANPIDYGNGVIQYWDTKSQRYPLSISSYAKKYDNPLGTFAWDVTDFVTGSGTYVAKIQNADSTLTAGLPEKPYKYWERFATYGFGLLVVYEDKKGEKMEYWVTEGCDMLMAKDYETAEAATTRATFAGKVSKGKVVGQLTTVLTASDKGTEIPPQNMVYYNLKEVGPSTAYDSYSIGVNYFDVKNINKGRNIVEFQDRNDYMTVRNAFLIATKK